MPEFIENFRKDLDHDYTDGRLNAPAAQRNSDVITEILKTVLTGDSGNVIEIGSGTGQHIVHFASIFPHLTWWPTDPEADHLKSIEAWRDHTRLDNVRPACRLDAISNWGLGKDITPPSDNIVCIFSANVIHIAPWEVALGILDGAQKYLQRDGFLILYGPYARGGDFLSEGNVNFDNSLKMRNSDWGVRDVDDIVFEAEKRDLRLSRVFDMPSHNSTIILTK